MLRDKLPCLRYERCHDNCRLQIPDHPLYTEQKRKFTQTLFSNISKNSQKPCVKETRMQCRVFEVLNSSGLND